MTSKARGLFRLAGEKGKPDSAFVEDGIIGFYVSEQEYRQEGFKPSYDELPWEPQSRAPETKRVAKKPDA